MPELWHQSSEFTRSEAELFSVFFRYLWGSWTRGCCLLLMAASLFLPKGRGLALPDVRPSCPHTAVYPPPALLFGAEGG